MDERPTPAGAPERATFAGVPALLSVVGGTMLVGGSFADWFGAVSLGVSAVSVSGTEAWEGRITAACGALAIVVGSLLVAGRFRAVSRALAVLAATGAISVAVSAYAVASARHHLEAAAAARLARVSGVDSARARADVERTLSRTGASVSVEAGAFAVVGGGALVAAAGVLPLATRRRAATVERAQPRRDGG